MNKKLNILVVGFGMMGCRHVQALLEEKGKFQVHVLEPSQKNIQINTTRIGACIEDCLWYTNLSDIPKIDLAIVATSSSPRFNIVKTLIDSGCKYFLLEKIVFQSINQFAEILALVKSTGVNIYCNFVNRYFAAYSDIKNLLKPCLPIEIRVYGNSFGLGCNAIHYIDIFQYITSCNYLSLGTYLVSNLENENKRGIQYREFAGTINFSTSKGDSLSIIADPDFMGGITINIRQGNLEFLLSEQSQKLYSIGMNFSNLSDFIITPTSKLSNKIALEILEGNCKLTKLEDTICAHELLFKVFNICLFGEHNDSRLCPIT